jgi:hypothetical protein
MCIDVKEIPYSFRYSPMHAGNALIMVRAGACAHFLPLSYVFLLFLHSQSLQFDFLLIGEQLNHTSDSQR